MHSLRKSLSGILSGNKNNKSNQVQSPIQGSKEKSEPGSALLKTGKNGGAPLQKSRSAIAIPSDKNSRRKSDELDNDNEPIPRTKLILPSQVKNKVSTLVEAPKRMGVVEGENSGNRSSSRLFPRASSSEQVQLVQKKDDENDKKEKELKLKLDLELDRLRDKQRKTMDSFIIRQLVGQPSGVKAVSPHKLTPDKKDSLLKDIRIDRIEEGNETEEEMTSDLQFHLEIGPVPVPVGVEGDEIEAELVTPTPLSLSKGRRP